MLGIDDPWVALAYLLCIGSALLCVIYGALNWNKGQEQVEPVDRIWAEQEDKVEKTL
ncbi:MAG TPA: hypothetical protein VFD66_07420 [Verrucomicrobiae bacterium]|nr:hypothetical protein [Verrucomicrobiae bacterium]